MRRWAIPDIHGCRQTLVNLLRAIGFRHGDVLYLLGDYIDRGPDSRGVIDTLIAMTDAGLDVRPLLGNHEDMLNAVYCGSDCQMDAWLADGGDATLASYGGSLGNVPPAHWNFLWRLPPLRVTDDFVFVHSGLDFTTQDPLTDTGWQTMAWDRLGTPSRDLIGGRTLVVGHSPASLDDIKQAMTAKADCIRLDNGCLDGGKPGRGNLVALNLDTWDIVSAPNADIVFLKE